ncbi:MAG: hypothetical protein HYR56_26085 [Acidobacteria bacterium]|nr:hypothetical protein [Acidobacteriota bacterium]MBI3427273.1 hypothetical protein [Acidobacteriota bacterium]
MFKRFCTQLCLCALLLPAFASAAQNPAPAAPIKDEDVIVIPAGTEMQLSLRDSVSSKLSEPGDEILATVRRDVVVDGRVIIQQGTEVVGRVTVAEPAGRLLKGGRLHLTFERIRLNSGERRLNSMIKSVSDFSRDEKIKSDGEGTLKGGKDGGKVLTNVGTAVGLASAGATVAVLAGNARAINSAINGEGYGYGGTIGALAGVYGGAVIVGILLSRGKEVRLDQNAIVRLKLERPLTVER